MPGPHSLAYFVHIDSARLVTIFSVPKTVVALLPGLLVPCGHDAGGCNEGAPNRASGHALLVWANGPRF